MALRNRRMLPIAVAAALILSTACRRPQQQNLPERVPTPPDMRFTGAVEAWPPRPAGRTNETDVRWSPVANALSDDEQTAIRNAVVQDQRVRAALGDRYAFIASAAIDPDKSDARGSTAERRTRLTFYSYSSNVAVEVVARGRSVESVRRREGYQPPEGAEEIQSAISLAQRDSRLTRVVQGLQATAILTYPASGQPGYGHRVLHVSFSHGDPTEVPQYYALVDLTDQKVLTAGPPPKP
jgi:hypothetical protein